MFLNELKKKESITFLSLVKQLAIIDKVFSDKESELISDYMEELSIANDDIKELTFEAAINELNDSTFRVKSIIYFELVGLALIDGDYDEAEVEFLNNLAAAFKISAEEQIAYVHYFVKIKDMYNMEPDKNDNIIELLKEKALKILPC